MNEFLFHLPTRILFGVGKEAEAGREARAAGASRVMVVYGGQSAVKSGLLGRVTDALAAQGLSVTLLGGVEPNPKLSLVQDGIIKARLEGVDLLLGVGGGSVIDTAKAIALGLPYQGDVWDLFDHLAEPKGCLPVGTVLTIPAAGSECSKAAVITKEEGGVKKGINHPLLRPRFSILNPELSCTLPPYQTAAGAVDIVMHTLERYLSKSSDNALTDRLAESLLLTVLEYAPKALLDPCDRMARSEIMWAGSISHSDLTGLGMPTDWATHQIEHELSTAYGVAHGAGLAAVWGSWARFTYQNGLERFAKLASRVFGIEECDKEKAALCCIERFEAFFSSIKMPICLSALIGRTISEEEIAVLAHKCTFLSTRTIGTLVVMDEPEIKAVYRMANH